jgi:hypothetical protein
MADIKLTVTDATGSKRDLVEMPNDQPIIRVLAALVQAMKLPLSGPDGQPMSYRFHHAETQTQLRDDATLASSGVNAGDTLRLVPEIVAG